MGCAAIAGRLCAALMASFGAEGRRPAVALSTSQTVRRTSTLSRSFWHPAVARESRCSHGAVKPGFACRCGQVARPFAVGLPVIDGLDGELARLEYQDTKGWPLLQRRGLTRGLRRCRPWERPPRVRREPGAAVARQGLRAADPAYRERAESADAQLNNG